MSTEQRKAYERARYQQTRSQAIRFLGGKCVQCGSIDDLEFDHIDPATKSFTIAKGIASKSWATILEELAKCQLLCASCHKQKSNAEISIPVTIDGVEYPSLLAAMKVLGIGYRKAKRRAGLL